MENIDETLYSRQMYVIGDVAMKSLASSSVLLHGLGGLGAEIAKNLVLMGVKHLAICDENTVTLPDLGRNCFLNAEDVKSERNRAEATCRCLQDLNPYVTVSVVDNIIFSETQLHRLQQFNVIVLTEFQLEAAVHLDFICRNQSPPIKVLVADAFGLLSWVFCDFSDSFQVTDPDGEEEKEILIGKISVDNLRVVVSTADNAPHFLETGDSVLLSDIVGMESINNTTFEVKVVSKTVFSVGGFSDTHNFGVYERGGRFQKAKKSLKLSFESLESQLWNPTLVEIDFNKNKAAENIHTAMLTLHEFLKQEHRLPNIRCLADAEVFLNLSKTINQKLKGKGQNVSELDESLLRQASFTAAGELPPLCAFLGGVVSQEIVKAVTGKFTPLKQWLHFDVSELAVAVDNQDEAAVHLFTSRGDRYDKLRACIGESCLDQLGHTSLFMVGCGAIGCEMLKNYTLLGIAVKDGKVTVTDNDLIEKSNLSRQFLFRNHHVQKSKSVIAASAASSINPDFNVESHQHRVCGETEYIYNQNFMSKQDVLINALDNVEARKYMDRRCVQSRKPLLDSGTMACKGHVQVILPSLTESYSAQSDPVDLDYPVCTIKSFPSHFEHTVQWAKEKFESFFENKLKIFEIFWNTHGTVDDVINRLLTNGKVQHLCLVLNVLHNRPVDFPSCVSIARRKFEKYFNHKAEQLLHSFPMDTLLMDGTLFWHSPRRPPKPLVFDENDETCLSFILSMAKLLAIGFGIQFSEKDLDPQVIKDLTKRSYIPVFQPQTNKVIVTDPLVKKAEDCFQSEDPQILAEELRQMVKQIELDGIKVYPQVFDKDNDLHVEFVSSASNLRSVMYKLETRSNLIVKQIAGRIIPAIASTTSAVSGLVAIELIKVVKKIKDREKYRNWFINLAIASFISTEPAPPASHEMRPGLLYSEWDRWDVQIDAQTTLQDVLDKLKEYSELKPNMVLQGTKIVWIPLLPNQNKKLKQPMCQLINKSSENFVEISATFETASGEDCIGPPIRLLLQ